MKVAVVADDTRTVSAHFGRAQHYLVHDIVEGAVKGREVRDKVGHGPGMGEHHHSPNEGSEMLKTHDAMLSAVKDCDVVISRGMGRPMYDAIKAAGMTVFVTRRQYPDEAVKAFVHGSLDNHLELLQ